MHTPVYVKHPQNIHTMSIYNTAVTFEPAWDPPSAEILNGIPIDDTFSSSIEEFHVGLGSITIKAVWRDSSGEQLVSPVQKIKIVGQGMNKIPPIDMEDLARLCTFIGQQHCNIAQIGPVSYRCYFRGNSEGLGRNFQKNKSFNLKPIEKSLDDGDTDGSNDGHDDGDDHPARLLGRHSGPLQLKGNIESELVQIIRLQAAQSGQMQADARAMFRQFREDQSANMQSINAAWSNLVTSANTLLDKASEEAEHARAAVTTANERLVQLSTEQLQARNGEQSILTYTMDMFKSAMQTQWNALGRDMTWERQIMYQQFDALAQDHKKDKRRGWVKDFAPIFLAVAGQIIAKTGNKAQGDLLQQIAEDQLKQEPEENEDDDADEEAAEETPKPTRPSAPQQPRAPQPPQPPHVPQRPVVDTQAKAPGEPGPQAVMGVPDGDAGAFFKKHPIASSFQLFGTMLKSKKGQITKIRTILGSQNYRTLQQAMTVTDDVSARTLGTQLFGRILSHSDKMDKLKKSLDDEQIELLTDISTMLFGKGPIDRVPAKEAS